MVAEKFPKITMWQGVMAGLLAKYRSTRNITACTRPYSAALYTSLV
ncbi:hypothetical protein [Campylobacter sp.]